MSWFNAALDKGGTWFVAGMFAVGFSPLILMAYLRGMDREERRANFMARCVADRGAAKDYECEALFVIADGRRGTKADRVAVDMDLINTVGISP